MAYGSSSVTTCRALPCVCSVPGLPNQLFLGMYFDLFLFHIWVLFPVAFLDKNIFNRIIFWHYNVSYFLEKHRSLTNIENNTQVWKCLPDGVSQGGKHMATAPAPRRPRDAKSPDPTCDPQPDSGVVTVLFNRVTQTLLPVPGFFRSVLVGPFPHRLLQHTLIDLHSRFPDISQSIFLFRPWWHLICFQVAVTFMITLPLHL